MIELYSTNNALILYLLCLAHWLVTIFFIPPPKTLKSVVNRNNTAIDSVCEMLSDFFKCGIRVFCDKLIQLLKMLISEGRLSSLILWPGCDGAILISLLSKLLYPSSCNLKLIGNLLESVLVGIISRQNTFS